MGPWHKEAWIKERVESLTRRTWAAPPRIYADTTSFMRIDRDDLIDLDGELFLVRGHAKEGRFGVDEQPKFWVKRALALEDGRRYILKLRFEETFKIHVGTTPVVCTRSGQKEARVLDLVRGDDRFMQGRSARDSEGNLVRVIHFIEGTDLINYLHDARMPHQRYVDEMLPRMLANTARAFRAIQFLNDNGLCHGDVRNDHILVERATDVLRWIDFDLDQDFHQFDLWSLGNVLHFVVGKGFVTFRELSEARPDVASRLGAEDASVFFPYRVMNLGKVFPYLPRDLSNVLERFSVGALSHYETIGQLVDDLNECASTMGWRPDEAGQGHP